MSIKNRLIESLATLILMTSISFGQSSEKKADCNFLKRFLEIDQARYILGIDSYKNIPIVFVDSKRYFQGCVLDSFNKKKVEISNDSTLSDRVHASYITIKHFQKIGKKYKFVVFHKNTDALIQVSFGKKRHKIIVEDYSIGYF